MNYLKSLFSEVYIKDIVEKLNSDLEEAQENVKNS